MNAVMMKAAMMAHAKMTLMMMRSPKRRREVIRKLVLQELQELQALLDNKNASNSDHYYLLVLIRYSCLSFIVLNSYALILILSFTVASTVLCMAHATAD